MIFLGIDWYREKIEDFNNYSSLENLTYVVTNDSIVDLKDIIDFSLDNEIPLNLHRVRDENGNHYELDSSVNEILDNFHRNQGFYDSEKEGCAIIRLKDGSSIYPKKLGEIQSIFQNLDYKGFICNEPQHGLAINDDGKVYSCFVCKNKDIFKGYSLLKDDKPLSSNIRVIECLNNVCTLNCKTKLINRGINFYDTKRQETSFLC